MARATIVASATALPPPPPGQGDTATLSFRPLATRYDRALDRLVFISDGPARLHLYDPVAQTDVQIALPLTPTCLTLSSDGQFAAVGHDAWLSYVDLGAQAVVSTWPISAIAGDVVLGDPVTIVDPATQIARATRFAYVFPSSDQWVAIHNLDLGNGAEKLSESIYAGMRAVLQPGTNHIFGVTANMVYPPVTDTGWATDEVRQAVRTSGEHVHVAHPDEVAAVIAYLASLRPQNPTENQASGGKG